jgi:hypothetical protein
MRSLARRGGCFVFAGALAACAPALDWRDIRPADSGVQLQFPCKPTSQQRRVPLAGATVNLVLYACAADGLTWGLGYADVGDPARVGPALAELAAAAAANLNAAPAQPVPLQPPGATPHAASLRSHLQGRLPDGKPVQMDVVVFTHGTQVFQASVLGERLPGEAVETFLGSVRFAR